VVRVEVFWKEAPPTIFWTEAAAADSWSMESPPFRNTIMAAWPLFGRKAADEARIDPSVLWVRKWTQVGLDRTR